MTEPTLADILAHEMEWRRSRLASDLDSLTRTVEGLKAQLNHQPFDADYYARSLSALSSTLADMMNTAAQYAAFHKVAASTKQG